MNQDDSKELKSLLIPLENAMLLSAAYSYLAWSKAFDNDPKLIQEAYNHVTNIQIQLNEQMIRKLWGK